MRRSDILRPDRVPFRSRKRAGSYRCQEHKGVSAAGSISFKLVNNHRDVVVPVPKKGPPSAQEDAQVCYEPSLPPLARCPRNRKALLHGGACRRAVDLTLRGGPLDRYEP